jgi:hypothetical protein|tara:strand:- start:72 stop:308 length:237 start_codon:yes stop_codon:yes gene_type:complete
MDTIGNSIDLLSIMDSRTISEFPAVTREFTTKYTRSCFDSFLSIEYTSRKPNLFDYNGLAKMYETLSRDACVPIEKSN